MDIQRKSSLLKTYSKLEPYCEVKRNEFRNVFGCECDTEILSVNLGDSLDYQEDYLGISLEENEDTHIPNLGESILNASFTSDLEVENTQLQVPRPKFTSTPQKFKFSETGSITENDVYQFPNDSGDEFLDPSFDTEKMSENEETYHSMSELQFSSELLPNILNLDISKDSNNDTCNILVEKDQHHTDEILSENGSITNHDSDLQTYQEIRSLPIISGLSSPPTVKRSKTVTSSKFVKKYTRTTSIQECRRLNCCVRNCARGTSIPQIKKIRFKYWSKTGKERQQWIIDKMAESTKFLFSTEYGPVCEKTFRALFGINKSTYYQLRQKYLSGAAYARETNRYRRRSSQFYNAIIWLEQYATFRADRMPDSPIALLPYGTRRIKIYKQYMLENERESSVIKKSTFLSMWKKYLPHLKIKKTNSFSKCTICTSIERQLETEHDPVKRAALINLRREHNDAQMAERKYYYGKRKSAVDSPSKYLSLIIDGMDQGKTALPHFVGRTAKVLTSADKVSTHITGVIAHGQDLFKTYVDLCQYPHDSNLTLNILLMIITEISRRLKNKLPPTVYIQADNCWRENKNKYVISFCELLVHLGVFSEVHLSFLFVGHTHEDIDAAFGRIAETLRTNDAETLPELLKHLPNVDEIKYIYNVRDWLIPSINDFQHHTDPLHFKFKKEEGSNNVRIFTKKTYNKPWLQTKYGAFQYNQNRPVLPIGVPKLVQPMFEKKINLKRLETCIKSWQCLFRNQIEQGSKIWWNDFLKYLNKNVTNQCFRNNEIVKYASWLLPKLPKNRHQDQQQEAILPPEIVRLVEEERREREVVVVPKKKNVERKKKAPKTKTPTRKKKS